MRSLVSLVTLLSITFMTSCSSATTTVPTDTFIVTPTSTSVPTLTPTPTVTLAPTPTLTPAPEPTSCPIGGDPGLAVLVARPFGGFELPSEVDLSLFYNDREVASGRTQDGLFPIWAKPGLYCVLATYGTFNQHYLVPDVCLDGEVTTVDIELPYSTLTILVQTQDGLPAYHPYKSLELVPSDVRAKTQDPWHFTRVPDSNAISVELLKGGYSIALTWSDFKGETQFIEKTIGLQAGQPITLPLPVLPLDGQLKVRTSSTDQDSYRADIEITDRFGTTIASDFTEKSSRSSQEERTWPLWIGEYTVTSTYREPLILTRTIPVEIQSGMVTLVQVGDTITPTVNIVTPGSQ